MVNVLGYQFKGSLFKNIFEVRERFIEKKKKKKQTNVCFALTPTYVQ